MADVNSRVGQKRYASPEILDWLNWLHAAHDVGLKAAFDAPETTGLPAIQVGPSEGKLLTLLLRMVQAKRVVEVGTLAGYSAIRLARGLPADGHVWTCELEEKHAAVARDNIAKASEAQRITVVVGPAKQTLQGLERNGPFDAVFIDADKSNYDAYAEWAVKNLRPGGLVLVDNAYFFGRLLEDSADASAVRRCHEVCAKGCDTVCVPTPDGLIVGIKR